MLIAFSSDEETSLTTWLVERLRSAGHEVKVMALPAPWPEVGRTVGEAVASGLAERGIVCCWTGTGVAMAANKVKGVRAALCTDAATAAGARRWNDANVLALSLRSASEGVAVEIVEAFLASTPDPDEMGLLEGLE